MTTIRLEKGWLHALVGTELERHDPRAALARLPPEVRGAGASRSDLAPAARLLVARSLRLRRLEPEPSEATEVFLDEIRLHLALLLDLDALSGGTSDRRGRLAEIVSFLAAALADSGAALAEIPVVPAAASGRDVEQALRAVEGALAARFHPPGDPLLGLPLHPGAVAVLRRRLARVATGFHRDGRLASEALVRHARYAVSESALLAEAIAGLLAAAEPPDARAREVRHRQIARLGLSRAAARAARAALAAPRAPADLAAAAPEGVRPFLVEQLFLALLRANPVAPSPHGDHQVWFEAFDDGAGPIDWQALAGEWEAATDAVVERVSTAVTDNLGAMVTEIRQTGELGQLLARAAAGTTLTPEERRKVRSQLIDLAKAIPALAIFAAPGGMLLLPLLAKLLPFNLLPSAWNHDEKRAAGKPKKLPPKADPIG